MRGMYPSLLPSAIVEGSRDGYIPLIFSWLHTHCIFQSWPGPGAVITVMCAPDVGWSYHPKHVERFTKKYNKLYIVASCWTIIDSLHVVLWSLNW